MSEKKDNKTIIKTVIVDKNKVISVDPVKIQNNMDKSKIRTLDNQKKK